VFAIIDAAFAQRRKMLRTALARLAGSASIASERLLAAGVDPKARGEMLHIADFARIAEQFSQPPSNRSATPAG
jgi:16S rRNA (adenine1518-N6/adenine1519-N6)-dimethyltransferase